MNFKRQGPLLTVNRKGKGRGKGEAKRILERFGEAVFKTVQERRLSSETTSTRGTNQPSLDPKTKVVVGTLASLIQVERQVFPYSPGQYSNQ